MKFTAALLILALSTASANFQFDVTIYDDWVTVPDTMKPTGYTYCVDIVKNGKFEQGLMHWQDNSVQQCIVVANDGKTQVPVGDGGVFLGPTPIADNFDSITVPEQGAGYQPQCVLDQRIDFKPHSPIVYAQISWVDRINTQSNRYRPERQEARIEIDFHDNNPATPEEPVVVYRTTNTNSDPDEQRRRGRVGDITTAIAGMQNDNGEISLDLTLDATHFIGPLYYQWDNVELWVCYADAPADTFAGGDPHFVTWGGHHFTYNGVCDLVLLHNPLFAHGLGMDIHVRTQRRRTFSFISHIAIRIGEDTLEIAGGQVIDMIVNGVSTPELASTTVGGYPLTAEKIDEHRNKYTIEIENGQSIIIKSWYDILTIQIHKATAADFGEATGLMGNFFTGKWLARDGVTVITDADEYGAEWQVGRNEDFGAGAGMDEDEIGLFQTLSMPQYPQKCVMPEQFATNLRQRRLSESKVDKTVAQTACAKVADKSDFEFCVYDVLAANDVGMAQVYM